MDGPLGMEPQCPCCQAIFGTSRHTCKRVNEQFIISGTCPLCSTTTPTIIRKVETTQPESAALTRPGEVYDESTIVTPPPKRAARTTASLKLQDLETEVERLQTLKQSEARQLAALLTEMAQLRIYRTTDNRTLQELRAELTELRQSKADALEIQQLKTEIKRVSGLFEKLLTERSALQPSPVIQPPRDNIAAVAPKVIAKAAESYISPYAVANWFLKSPFAIEECLSELAQPLVKATQDFRTGELREDDAGKFILLQDKSLAADLRFVLPNQTRFQQAQVFARYESCYECQHPASGKVWVLRLAVARRAAEQVWQVVTKGELEIR